MISNNIKTVVFNLCFCFFTSRAELFIYAHSPSHSPSVLIKVAAFIIPLVVYVAIGFLWMKDQGAPLKNLLSVSLIALLAPVILYAFYNIEFLGTIAYVLFVPFHLMVYQLIKSIQPTLNLQSVDIFTNTINMAWS